MNDLPKRTLTALVFAGVMLGGILWNRSSFSVLLFIINAVCLYEYLIITRGLKGNIISNENFSLLLTLGLSSLILIIDFTLPEDSSLLAGVAVITCAFFLIMASELFSHSAKPVFNAMLNAGGLVYITFPLIMLYSLTSDGLFTALSWFPYYASIPLGIILLIWSNDTFAYFTGRLLGRHKILPSVSPKKTWEGFFGGFLFSMIAAWLLSLYFERLGLVQWLIVASLVVVFGSTGDFFESMLKRQAGIKDSGNILPGHGGFLDRFDALLFCLPFVFLYLIFTL